MRNTTPRVINKLHLRRRQYLNDCAFQQVYKTSIAIKIPKKSVYSPDMHHSWHLILATTKTAINDCAIIFPFDRPMQYFRILTKLYLWKRLSLSVLFYLTLPRHVKPCKALFSRYHLTLVKQLPCSPRLHSLTFHSGGVGVLGTKRAKRGRDTCYDVLIQGRMSTNKSAGVQCRVLAFLFFFFWVLFFPTAALAHTKVCKTMGPIYLCVCTGVSYVSTWPR